MAKRPDILKDLIATTPTMGEAAGPATSVVPFGTQKRPNVHGILGSRDRELAELESGVRQNTSFLFVDPAICRIWAEEDRGYNQLDREACDDLISSFISEGVQHLAAIVRPLKNDLDHQYEVVFGNRRHWSVTWMRANNYPDFKFKIEVRDLNDEECFRLTDIENRNRKDISDYQRARKYLRGMHGYYGGSQEMVAKRLNISQSWLSKLLDMAKLPDEVVSAFGSTYHIKVWHSQQLSVAMKGDAAAAAIIEAAKTVAEEQASLKAAGAKLIDPKIVVKRLLNAAPKSIQRAKNSKTSDTINGPDGVPVFKAEKGRAGTYYFKALPDVKLNRGALWDVVKSFAISKPDATTFTIEFPPADDDI